MANESPEFPRTSKRPVGTALFGVTIFTSAFLLFQVQPLIAKLILPWFGGSAAVWTTCMLFFQMALLLGYLYAHVATTRLPSQRQAYLHLGLLAVSLLCLPVLPNAWWKPSGNDDPLWRILGLLTATIGLPYFLVSSTSPLLQSWMARAGSGAIPYRFFALSNAGSMLALLSYPIVVEPRLTNGQQAWGWSAGYVLFAVLCGFVAFRSRDAAVLRTGPIVDDAAPPGFRDYALWIALAGSASALLLSVTNHLSQNVASIPFLWILPLALYLLSFILCFESSIWYRRGRIFAALRGGVGSDGLRVERAVAGRHISYADRALLVGVVCLLHGLPRGTSAAEALCQAPDRLLPDDFGGRRDRRPLCRLCRAARVQCALRISDLDGLFARGRCWWFITATNR